MGYQRRLGALLAAVIVLNAEAILACSCDSECPEGEIYSDEAEMCVDRDTVS